MGVTRSDTDVDRPRSARGGEMPTTGNDVEKSMTSNDVEKSHIAESTERREYAASATDASGVAAPLLSPKEGRRLRLKLDVVVLTLTAIAFFVAYVDRNNIGYARLLGFEKDLHMTDDQFDDAVMVFYAGYLAMVFPANLMLNKVGPRIQFGGAALLFGMISCCLAAARGFGSVAGLRVLLGMGEGMLQSLSLYLITLYGREHLTKRIAIFYSASTIAGAFSGLIAYGVSKDLKHDPRPLWQWLFIIEGSIGLFVGVCLAALLPPSPSHAKSCYLLTERELDSLKALGSELDGIPKTFDRRQALQCITDKRVVLLTLLSVTNIVIIAATGAFLPTIIKELGFTSERALLVSAIPYSLAFVSMIVAGVVSDWLQVKGYLVLIALSTAAIGFIVLITTRGVVAGMAGVCLVVMGVYPSAILQQGWVPITFAGKTKRALAWGIVLVFGQGVGLAAAHFYTDPPRFVRGHSICLGFVVVGIVATALTIWSMKRDNKARDEELAAYAARGEEHPGLRKSIEETCDMHITFRYLC